MWFEAADGLRTLVTEPAALGTALLGALAALVRQHRRGAEERLRSRRLQAELTAYMLLDDWRVADARAMGRRICRAISRHSAFGSAALLVRDASGRLRLTASQRSDDLTVQALERWAEAESLREQKRQQRRCAGRQRGAADRPVPQVIRLERRSGYQPGDPAALAWCTALIVPICNARGQVTGAIAVCADRFLGRPRAALAAALEPLTALAARFSEGVAALSPDRNKVKATPGQGRARNRAGGRAETLNVARRAVATELADSPAHADLA